MDMSSNGPSDEPVNTTHQRTPVCLKADELLWRIHLGAHVRFSDRTEVLVFEDWPPDVHREGQGRPIATDSNDEYEKRKLFGAPSVYVPIVLCIVVTRRQIEHYFLFRRRMWALD